MHIHYTQIEIAPYLHFANAWTVEAVDDEGGIEIAIFDGPRAYDRAELYRSGYDQPITSKCTSLTHV